MDFPSGHHSITIAAVVIMIILQCTAYQAFSFGKLWWPGIKLVETLKQAIVVVFRHWLQISAHLKLCLAVGVRGLVPCLRKLGVLKPPYISISVASVI